MSSIKTAVSIDESLYDEAEKLASEMKLSRSRLYSLALALFIERQESRRILDSLNSAYDATPMTPEERRVLEAMSSKQRVALETDW